MKATASPGFSRTGREADARSGSPRTGSRHRGSHDEDDAEGRHSLERSRDGGSQKVSSATVQRIWKKHKLQPHRVESFKFSNDPQFARKVRDIVGLYMNPPDKAIVLSVDEKSQIQALDRTQPILPLRPGLPGAANARL